MSSMSGVSAAADLTYADLKMVFEQHIWPKIKLIIDPNRRIEIHTLYITTLTNRFMGSKQIVPLPLELEHLLHQVRPEIEKKIQETAEESSSLESDLLSKMQAIYRIFIRTISPIPPEQLELNLQKLRTLEEEKDQLLTQVQSLKTKAGVLHQKIETRKSRFEQMKQRSQNSSDDKLQAKENELSVLSSQLEELAKKIENMNERLHQIDEEIFQIHAH